LKKIALVLLAVVAAPLAGAEPAFSPEQVEFFEKEVRPLLADNCFKCHGPDLKKGGLDLQSRDGAIKKLRSGERAVVPGNSADSA